MAAPKGNKHAEKWTRESTIQYLEHIYKHAGEPDVFFLGEALLAVGLYNDVWSYWKQKWEDDEEIIDRMKYIMQCFEVKLFRAAALKQIHAGVAMFALKCHYGWAPPKAEKEKPAAAPVYTAPAPVVEKETVKEAAAATLLSEEGRVVHTIESTQDIFSSTDIGHHAEVLMADTGS